MDSGLFHKYGKDAVQNKYYDKEKDREFVVMNYTIDKEKEEEKVILHCRSYDEESDEYDQFQHGVLEIQEKDRFEHVEGDADYVI